MTKIDDKSLEQISGAGGSQDVQPELGTRFPDDPDGPPTTKPIEGGSPDPESEGANSGGTQNLQQ